MKSRGYAPDDDSIGAGRYRARRSQITTLRSWPLVGWWVRPLRWSWGNTAISRWLGAVWWLRHPKTTIVSVWLIGKRRYVFLFGW